MISVIIEMSNKFYKSIEKILLSVRVREDIIKEVGKLGENIVKLRV